jgi:hypothetical protein
MFTTGPTFFLVCTIVSTYSSWYLHSLTNHYHHHKQVPASVHSVPPFIDHLGLSWWYILEKIKKNVRIKHPVVGYSVQVSAKCLPNTGHKVNRSVY